ncbi:hypothetical protein LTR66_011291 [Elasticomyces elasticus]|nr:hypothetical protein LTR66_011291 [Elasticomyces elasticus]KAK4990865.1 hypothetical protein LTR50_002233 [Elasticomyces elasticus]
MVSSNPMLAVNREGYQAVIRLQLARRKTTGEQKWAALKAESWPPWKEDRTGMDTAIGIEDGISVAGKTLRHTRAAGYAPGSWEKVASLFAGWDTDNSPTIQTRSLLTGHISASDRRSDIWAARITCTRTLQEAWSCFLAYEDDKLSPSQAVYLAMFQKIHFEQKRLRSGDKHAKLIDNEDYWEDETRSLYAGDMREISPPPASTHLETYTNVPPPSIGQLLHRMKTQGLSPSGRCLAFLVSTAPTLSTGLDYLLSCPTLDRSTVHALFELHYSSSPPVHDLLLTAVIQLLCRFSDSRTARLKIYSSQKLLGNGHFQLDHHNPMIHALYILKMRKPTYRPAWNTVLSALVKSRRTSILVGFPNQDARMVDCNPTQVEDIFALKVVRHLKTLMHSVDHSLDNDSFHSLCVALENATLASLAIRERATQTVPGGSPTSPTQGLSLLAFAQLQEEMRRILRSGARFIQVQFRDLVGSHAKNPHQLSSDQEIGLSEPNWSKVSLKTEQQATSPVMTEGLEGFGATSLPRLLTVPSWLVLHAYVRVLGFLQDHQALVNLALWIKEHMPELQVEVEEKQNARRMRYRVMVAFRVFTDGDWVHYLNEKQRQGEPVARENAVEHSTVKGQGSTGPAGPDKNHFSKARAPQAVRDRVRALVKDIQGEKGWPDEAAAEKYCCHPRFAKVDAATHRQWFATVIAAERADKHDKQRRDDGEKK